MTASYTQQYAGQIAAIGASGQKRPAGARIHISGLGGLGNMVAHFHCVVFGERYGRSGAEKRSRLRRHSGGATLLLAFVSVWYLIVFEDARGLVIGLTLSAAALLLALVVVRELGQTGGGRLILLALVGAIIVARLWQGDAGQ
jgi:hypothetical protein